MKRLSATLVALLLAGSFAWAQLAPPTPDQSGSPAEAASSDTGAAQAKVVQGKIKSLDQSSVTLDDGTTLTIPKSVKLAPGTLKEGAMVKATYEELDGKKMVISIEVLSPSAS